MITRQAGGTFFSPHRTAVGQPDIPHRTLLHTTPATDTGIGDTETGRRHVKTLEQGTDDTGFQKGKASLMTREYGFATCHQRVNALHSRQALCQFLTLHLLTVDIEPGKKHIRVGHGD